MPHQGSLFGDEPDPAAARTARDEGIATADFYADRQWKQAALDAIRYCAVAHPEGFTADHVLARLNFMGAPNTHNLAALGPVFQRARRAGVIEKTGELWPSTIPRRHRDLTVWRTAETR